MREENQTKEYEIAYLVRNESGGEEVRQAVAREGGEIVLQSPPERIALAYKINGEAAAYFGYFHFRMLPENLPGLDHVLRTSGSVLRFLVITPPFVKTRPRVAPRPKSISSPEPERKPAPPLPLSNEALEKKIEEILRE